MDIHAQIDVSVDNLYRSTTLGKFAPKYVK